MLDNVDFAVAEKDLYVTNCSFLSFSLTKIGFDTKTEIEMTNCESCAFQNKDVDHFD